MSCIPIQVKDIKPGMYLVEVNESWRQRPYLYNKAGLITSALQVEDIANQGYLEAYYDPDRTVVYEEKEEQTDDIEVPEEDNVWKKIGSGETKTLYQLPEPKVSLTEEFLVQDPKYDTYAATVKRIMTEAKAGHFDMKSALPHLEEVVTSINRNADGLLALAKIKTFDEYTFVHSVNVAIYALAFGQYLGMDGEELQSLGISGLFHDIGKMKIPPQILNAPRKLTEKEFELVKKHPEFGVQMVELSPDVNQLILEGIIDHHERISGNGYPKGKKGNEISPFGKILSLCDVYDALSSRRSYRRATTPGIALATMYDMGTTMWDRTLLEHFIKMVGIFPVSTPVLLSDGQIGLVIKSNQERPMQPVVLICIDRYGHKLLNQRTIDLSVRSGIKIIRAVTPKEFPMNARSIIRNMKAGM